MRTDQHQEIEIKLQVGDEAAMRASLVGLGFVEIVPRGLEQNRIYDTADGVLRARGELIRLREFDGKNVLTYKGRATVGKHKEREEIEVVLGATEAMATILGRLGLEPRFRYEKYRSEWQRPGDDGIVMLDETPIGTFVELEGTGDWIDRTAVDLGYNEQDYLNLSYARLFAARCLAEGRAAGDMVFDAV
ncbi:MAG: class IV adenylate cyclase [Acidobacteria bacterium]|nr:class IV adenylate cyclase [Acidobacteriota bacterium]